MADQEEETNRLSPRDEGLLHFIKDGHSLREICQILDVLPKTARRWVSEAIRHFAEMQQIPIELNLDARHLDKKLRLGDKEKVLLDAYFEAKDKKISPLPPDFRSNVFAQLPEGTWAQNIEQERLAAKKRHR
jgi:hypothetical protein